MRFKEDWRKARARIEAWWAGEPLDRALLQVTAPRPGERRLSPPASLEQRWLDPDYVVAAAAEEMRLTYHGGEALPIFWPNLGPDVFAAYPGCELRLGEDTAWSVPLLGDWRDLFRVRLYPAGPWWQATVELLQAAQAGRPVGAGANAALDAALAAAPAPYSGGRQAPPYHSARRRGRAAAAHAAARRPLPRDAGAHAVGGRGPAAPGNPPGREARPGSGHACLKRRSKGRKR